MKRIKLRYLLPPYILFIGPWINHLCKLNLMYMGASEKDAYGAAIMLSTISALAIVLVAIENKYDE